jgi:molybdopterin/thiamine biosynthesis adenylyltransferase
MNTTSPHGTPTPDYSRQIALREVGAEGGATPFRLGARVGAEASGSGAAYLRRRRRPLSIVDADRLEPSNLHRQTWYA